MYVFISSYLCVWLYILISMRVSLCPNSVFSVILLTDFQIKGLCICLYLRVLSYQYRMCICSYRYMCVSAHLLISMYSCPYVYLCVFIILTNFISMCVSPYHTSTTCVCLHIVHQSVYLTSINKLLVYLPFLNIHQYLYSTKWKEDVTIGHAKTQIYIFNTGISSLTNVNITWHFSL